MSAEQRIKELGLELPTASKPAGNYASAARSGDLLFLSGKAALAIDGKAPKGRLAKVLDGASDLLVAIFGSGLHARSVVGVGSLRNGVPLTLKATIEVKRAP